MLKLFTDCIIVKGYSKDAIYDLTRRTYYLIDKEQSSWLDYIQTAENLSAFDNDPKFHEFLSFLNKNELVFECVQNEFSHFPQITRQWDHPSVISNIILIRSSESDLKFKEYLERFEKLGVVHFQLILKGGLNTDYIIDLLTGISCLPIKSIEMVICKNDFERTRTQIIKNRIDKLINIYVTDCSTFQVIPPEGNKYFNCICLTNSIEEIYSQNPPDPSYFTVNMNLFMESHFFNNFFNKKLIIDEWNNIVDQPGGQSYGNIEESIERVLNNQALKELWRVTKDDIEGCKDCEFRYMCVDSRKPINIEGRWVMQSECNYDPYKGMWQWEQQKEEIHEEIS